MTTALAASRFTDAPLRNRVRFELFAPAAEVWALLGDLERFPEYSEGLQRVEARVDATGRCTEYVCHFKPMGANDAGIVSREVIRWWEPSRGYASSGAQADAFGLKNDLHLVDIAPSNDGVVVTVDEYYEAQDLDFMKSHFDEALTDMGENLARRFGGRLVERYVEK